MSHLRCKTIKTGDKVYLGLIEMERVVMWWVDEKDPWKTGYMLKPFTKIRTSRGRMFEVG